MSGRKCAEEEIDCQSAKAAILSFENSLARGDFDDDKAGKHFREKIGNCIANFNHDVNQLLREYIQSPGDD